MLAHTCRHVHPFACMPGRCVLAFSGVGGRPCTRVHARERVHGRARSCRHMCARGCVCVQARARTGPRVHARVWARVCVRPNARTHAHACACTWAGVGSFTCPHVLACECVCASEGERACARALALPRVCMTTCGCGLACVHTRARTCTRVPARVWSWVRLRAYGCLSLCGVLSIEERERVNWELD